jgi:hypothetical protein
MGVALVLAMAVAACGDDESRFVPADGSSSGGDSGSEPCGSSACGLTFEGSGFDDYDGMTLYWGLQQQGEMGLTLDGKVVVDAGGFRVDVPNAFSKGGSYNINYFVDANDDGDCEIGVDPAWRQQLSNVQDGTTIQVTAASGFMSNFGCSGHN